MTTIKGSRQPVWDKKKSQYWGSGGIFLSQVQEKVFKISL